MELAAKKRDLGETYVIPILLRHVAWEDTAIGKLEPLPKDGRPISGRPMDDREKVVKEIAKYIRQVIDKIRQDLSKKDS
jgi:hypothetical protein